MTTDENSNKSIHLIESFCITHQLPEQYRAIAQQYFLPLAKELFDLSNKTNKTISIGINGSQGSGKSTLASLLTLLLSKLYSKKVANLSIDDFYHTRANRIAMANEIHPLFKTRGVPGTHDIKLLSQTLNDLSKNNKTIPIVRFNKAIDDRHPEDNWDNIEGPVDIILLEGWCVGVSPQAPDELGEAINTLEKNEDSDAYWRKEINTRVKSEYTAIFNSLDKLIMLKAPSFNCVFEWRNKQEDKLRENSRDKGGSKVGIMDKVQLTRFIEHYERLTKHMLRYLPSQADIVFTLDTGHKIIGRNNNERAQ